MNIQDNIGKIAWSALDKGLFVLFGLVMLFQIRHLSPTEFGLFSLIWSLNNWLLGISDSFALQGLVQFGSVTENRARVNFISTILNFVLLLIFPLLLFLFAVIQTNSLSGNLYTTFYYLPIFTISAIPRTIVLKILTREFRYKDIFLVNLVYFGVMTVLTFYYVSFYNELNFLQMLYIFVIGGSLSSIFSIIIAFSSLKFDLNKQHPFTFRKFISFSLPMTLISLCQSIPRNLDVYFIEFTAGAQSTLFIGLYNSAKTLYRVIDESSSAAYSLMYPVAVKYINLKDYSTLKKTYVKAVSHLLLAYLFIITLSYLGLIDFLVNLILPIQYKAATGIFKIMILAAIPLPFVLLIVSSTAAGKLKKVLFYSAIAAITSSITFLIAGYSQNVFLIPLGIIVYNFTLGLLSFLSFRKEFGFPLKDITQSVRDIKNLIKNKK